MRFGCIYDHGDGLKFCDSISQAPKDANVLVGAVLRVPGSDLSPVKAISRFFPGEMVGSNFVPGQRMSAANGEFIPAACIRSGKIYCCTHISLILDQIIQPLINCIILVVPFRDLPLYT